ncbi:hypothetical protein [Virgibacillus sediminis]|uniref:Uncharacterized protein n=1 Tax=Virgibacillus sediminis TaxID=202260 RepID=A0ABV7A3K6_9BACI
MRVVSAVGAVYQQLKRAIIRITVLSLDEVPISAQQQIYQQQR